MQPTHTRRSAPAAVTALLVLATLSLAACGGSSKTGSTSSTSATAASTTTTSTTTATNPGHNSARRAALQACLAKQGITLPPRKPPSGGGFPGGEGGPTLPKGMTRAQFDLALRKCGAGDFGGRGLAGGRFKNPALRQALTQFARCLRENGVNVPEPNTSGKGPVFNTKGLSTTSPQFKQAERRCAPALLGSFRTRPGSVPPGSKPGAPGPLGAVPTPNGG